MVAEKTELIAFSLMVNANDSLPVATRPVTITGISDAASQSNGRHSRSATVETSDPSFEFNCSRLGSVVVETLIYRKPSSDQRRKLAPLDTRAGPFSRCERSE
jgi:hypothetical protein